MCGDIISRVGGERKEYGITESLRQRGWSLRAGHRPSPVAGRHQGRPHPRALDRGGHAKGEITKAVHRAWYTAFVHIHEALRFLRSGVHHTVEGALKDVQRLLQLLLADD